MSPRIALAAALVFVALPAEAEQRTFRTVGNAVEATDEGETILEFSVGTSHAFPSERVFDFDDDTELAPTTSAFFFGEYYFNRYFRAVLNYTLPVTPTVTFVDGERVEVITASSLAAGVNVAPFHFNVAGQSSIELQLALLGGLTLESVPTGFPQLVGRVHFSTGGVGGVSVYLATQYTFVIDTTGILYGVGYRF